MLKDLNEMRAQLIEIWENNPMSIRGFARYIGVPVGVVRRFILEKREIETKNRLILQAFLKNKLNLNKEPNEVD